MLQLKDADRLIAQVFGAKDAILRNDALRFVAIEGGDGLRWIIPADLGPSSHVLADWRPYKRSSRLAWRIVQVASQAGILSRVPGTRLFEVDLTGIEWADYGWLRSYPPCVITYVGTAGPHQKLVCTFVDPHAAAAILVVKFPLVDSANSLLWREYENLNTLVNEGRDIGPHPLRIDGQIRFTVQSYLQGRPVGVAIGQAHLDFLAGLVQPRRHLELRTARSELYTRRDYLASIGALSGAAHDMVTSLLEDGAWNGVVPAVRIHGDFAPWNLKRRPDGRLSAIDWEDSEENGLPYVDLLHFRASVTNLLGRKCHVPWKQYTRAIMSVDSRLTESSMQLAYNAAAAHQVLVSQMSALQEGNPIDVS